MANTPVLSTAGRNAILDGLRVLFDAGGAGTIKIYTTGSGRPAGPATAITDQVLLATLTFSATSFGAASAGVATAAAITSDSAADATGTAAWARLASGAGTAVLDLEVGTSGADINFGTVAFVANAVIAMTSLTLSKAA